MPVRGQLPKAGTCTPQGTASRIKEKGKTSRDVCEAGQCDLEIDGDESTVILKLLMLPTGRDKKCRWESRFQSEGSR